MNRSRNETVDVTALVVTRNRCAELARCVEAIRTQSRRPREILVVDNGSEDHTAAWLEGQADVISVRQPNVGSAGGFARGFNEARRMRPASLWVMDDDCLPASDCLERLLDSPAFSELGSVVGSLVLAADSERLAFPMPLSSSHVAFLDWYSRVTDSVVEISRDAGPLGHFWVCLFNSVLLRKDVVEQVGVPRQELFIWGDEVEYLLRLRAAGLRTYTVLDSVARHPAWSPEATAPWKEAYALRNKVWINRRYGRWPRAKALARAAQAVGRRRFDLLPPLWDGVRGDLSRAYHVDPRWAGSA